MLLLQKMRTHQEGVLSLLNASRDEATGAAPKDKADMENKKEWKVPGCLHFSKDKGRREMIFR